MKTIATRVRQRLPALLLPLMLGALTPAMANDIYVIAHPSVKLSADAIRDVYIGEKQFAGDIKILPADNAASQAIFLSKVLKLDETRYANLWVKKAFRDALNPPALRTSDREVADFVRKTPGAISYISSPPADGGVTLIQKF